MNYLDRYRISFGSLTSGEHEFEFEIDDKFFEQFENSPVQKGFVDVLVTLNKKDHLLLLDFTMEGSVTVACDRCGEPLDVEIAGFSELHVKFGEETGEAAEDVIVISPKEHELNVAQFIYEYVVLLIPMRNVHEEDDKGNTACNPEMIKSLNKFIIREAEEKKDKEDKDVDPRWDMLRNINLN
jgi:uncharacterized protein